MIKALKWEFLKRLQQVKIPLLIMACLSIIILIMPQEALLNFWPLALISSLFGAIYFFSMCIYLMVAITIDYTRPYAVMEKSVTTRPWQLLLAKLLNNILYVVLLFLTVKGLELLLDRFTTENMSFFKLNINGMYLIVMGCVLPLLILFSYLMVKSFSMTRKFPMIAMCLFLLCIVGFALYLVPKIHLYVFIGAGTIISCLLFFACCTLYDKRFEI